MPQALRIFLESKEAFNVSEGGHLYLVLRTVEVDSNGTIVSNNYDASKDRQMSGTSDTGTATLRTGERLLAQSDDYYRDAQTPSVRHSEDITAKLNVQNLTGGNDAAVRAVWDALASTVSKLNDMYVYELPFVQLFDHLANSNAVVLTALESMNVDVRDIVVTDGPFIGQKYVESFFPRGIPGADSYRPTLLATEDVTSANGLNQEINGPDQAIRILGRDNRADTFLNTKLNEKFFGEQDSNGSSVKDVVSYEGSDGPLTMSVAPGRDIVQDYLRLSSSNTGQDDLFGIEQVKLSNYADRLVVNSSVIDLPKTTIDAGSSGAGAGDILDFSTLSTGIRITQHDDGTLGATQKQPICGTTDRERPLCEFRRSNPDLAG
jgi:hypothetical protein